MEKSIEQTEEEKLENDDLLFHLKKIKIDIDFSKEGLHPGSLIKNCLEDFFWKERAVWLEAHIFLIDQCIKTLHNDKIKMDGVSKDHNLIFPECYLSIQIENALKNPKKNKNLDGLFCGAYFNFLKGNDEKLKGFVAEAYYYFVHDSEKFLQYLVDFNDQLFFYTSGLPNPNDQLTFEEELYRLREYAVKCLECLISNVKADFKKNIWEFESIYNHLQDLEKLIYNEEYAFKHYLKNFTSLLNIRDKFFIPLLKNNPYILGKYFYEWMKELNLHYSFDEVFFEMPFKEGFLKLAQKSLDLDVGLTKKELDYSVYRIKHFGDDLRRYMPDIHLRKQYIQFEIFKKRLEYMYSKLEEKGLKDEQ